MDSLVEIIFDDFPKTYGTYRVVCRYGFWLRPTNWRFSLEKLIERKRFLLKPKMVWSEIDTTWCEEQCETRERLKLYAIETYNQVVEKPIELTKKAMSLY